jgi:hypothetical protein
MQVSRFVKAGAACVITAVAVLGVTGRAHADPVDDTTTLAFGPNWEDLGGIPAISAQDDIAVVGQNQYDAIASPQYLVPSVTQAQPCGAEQCQEFSNFLYSVTPAGWYQAPAGAPTARIEIIIVDITKNTQTQVASYDNTLPPGTAINADIGLGQWNGDKIRIVIEADYSLTGTDWFEVSKPELYHFQKVL